MIGIGWYKKTRYDNKVLNIWKLWKSISGEHIDEKGLAKLLHIHYPLLKKTAEYVKQKQLSGYQENILKELLADMAKADELSWKNKNTGQKSEI